MTNRRARPILISGPMIRALLEGRKTQTRQIIKPQPTTHQGWEEEPGWAWFWKNHDKGLLHSEFLDQCPYGKSGDLLWVREKSWQYGKWVKNGHTNAGRQKWKFRAANVCPFGEWVRFEPQPKIDRQEEGFQSRPSIFLPKWASRLTLEITEVRVQRSQEISKEDAIAEGASMRARCCGFTGRDDG